MNIAFIVTIDSESVDPNALLGIADDISAKLESDFDVVDVKPWARPTAGLPSATQQPPITGAPPVSGAI